MSALMSDVPARPTADRHWASGKPLIMLKLLSILGYLGMLGGLLGLAAMRRLFSPSLFVIVPQILAVGLLLWARITFGRRSFHAVANPTEGGLVTTGPYYYIRHPIYTAVCLFVWAGIGGRWSWGAGLCGGVVVVASLARMHCEEVMVTARYPEYTQYKARTSRMIPFVY
jgi:protein-S-isoprenylcysteine O-methyltransferase Ste14